MPAQSVTTASTTPPVWIPLILGADPCSAVTDPNAHAEQRECWVLKGEHGWYVHIPLFFLVWVLRWHIKKWPETRRFRSETAAGWRVSLWLWAPPPFSWPVGDEQAVQRRNVFVRAPVVARLLRRGGGACTGDAGWSMSFNWKCGCFLIFQPEPPPYTKSLSAMWSQLLLFSCKLDVILHIFRAQHCLFLLSVVLWGFDRGVINPAQQRVHSIVGNCSASVHDA